MVEAETVVAADGTAAVETGYAPELTPLPFKYVGDGPEVGREAKFAAWDDDTRGAIPAGESGDDKSSVRKTVDVDGIDTTTGTPDVAADKELAGNW